MLPAQVLSVGATNLSKLATDQSVLRAIREAYTIAVDNTIIFALAAACVAIPLGALLEVKNVKQVASQRKVTEAEQEKCM